jgi:hypothetical protein
MSEKELNVNFTTFYCTGHSTGLSELFSNRNNMADREV